LLLQRGLYIGHFSSNSWSLKAGISCPKLSSKKMAPKNAKVKVSQEAFDAAVKVRTHLNYGLLSRTIFVSAKFARCWQIALSQLPRQVACQRIRTAPAQ
jgi:hypothetical protein